MHSSTRSFNQKLKIKSPAHQILYVSKFFTLSCHIKNDFSQKKTVESKSITHSPEEKP